MSSFCSAGGCVQVEYVDAGVFVGSTVRPGRVFFDHAEWDAFEAAVVAGEFRRPGAALPGHDDEETQR